MSHDLHEIRLRPVDMDDAELLLEWRNDPLTIKNAVAQKGKLELESHKAWLARTLDDKNIEMLMAVANDTPIGQVRFDPITEPPEETVVSIVMAPIFRGRGYGRAALAAACSLKKDQNLIAFIKGSNKASQRIFEKVGFAEVGSSDLDDGDTILTYRRGPELDL